MNKHIYKALCAIALVMSTLASCELDQFPESGLTDDKAWATYADATKQYTGLLATLRGVVGGDNAYITDVQSDLFNSRVSSADLQKEHNWTFTGTQFAGDNIWSGNYSVVKQANYILQNIGKFEADPTLSTEQHDNIQNIKGTAYFARAYAYANLIVRYCKDYEPGTRAQGGTEDEPGLPIVRTVNSEDRPARATIQETCDFIQENLDSATLLLTNTGSTYKPGSDALSALKARYYLYTHQFDKAIENAQYIVDNYDLASGLTNVANMWNYDEADEIIYEPQQTQDETTNTYSTIYVSYNFVYGNLYTELLSVSMNPEFLPTQGLVDLYDDTDVRKTIYFTPATTAWASILQRSLWGHNLFEITTSGENSETGYVFYKFPGNLDLMKQQIWYSEIYNMSKAFRSAEDYLILAECYLRSTTRDEDQARAYLNALREARMADPIADDVTGDELVKEMQDEWTREMVGEGFRLDCLKRWHQGFKRLTPQSFRSNVLINTAGYQNLEISADDPRFVWPIPQQDIQANKNLVQNPGY